MLGDSPSRPDKHGPTHSRMLVSISRSVTNHNWVEATLSKHWFVWGRSGSSSRVIATTGFWVDPGSEAVLMSQVLRDLALAVSDEIYRL